MFLMWWNAWCSFQGFEFMRSIAGGVSAGGSLALAHHLLTLFDSPSPDLLTSCNWPAAESSLDLRSFCLGLLVGGLVVLGIQLFCTLRWAFAACVQVYLSGNLVAADSNGRNRSLYKLLWWTKSFKHFATRSKFSRRIRKLLKKKSAAYGVPLLACGPRIVKWAIRNLRDLIPSLKVLQSAAPLLPLHQRGALIPLAPGPLLPLVHLLWVQLQLDFLNLGLGVRRSPTALGFGHAVPWVERIAEAVDVIRIHCRVACGLSSAPSRARISTLLWSTGAGLGQRHWWSVGPKRADRSL